MTGSRKFTVQRGAPGLYFVLTCTCDAVHPGWIEPASLIELTTSRAEVPRARRSCRAHWRLSPSPFSIVRSRKFSVLRGGLPWLWLPAYLAGLQFACTTCEAVWVEVGPGSVYSLEDLQRDQTSGAFFVRAVPVY